MRLRKTIDWIEPLDLAAGVPDSEKIWAFFYSSLKNDFTGNLSILALRPKECISTDNFDEFEKKLSNDRAQFENSWFGYLGYGLKDSLESLPEDADGVINLPDLQMVNYRLLIIFNHDIRKINIWSQSDKDLDFIPKPSESKSHNAKISDIESNMTKEQYLDNVQIIKDAIGRGDLYQANLTRKFYGTINVEKPFHIFSHLCNVSPAPYSAFLRFGDKYIISSSPERFIVIDKDGNADTRPIKGSAPRFDDASKDNKSRQTLANSEKDKAENLMIVDLSRNDLSKNAVQGSVKTEKLFEITSYATVHHMASTVKARKDPSKSSLDMIKGCFPPGSMTGAPKIKAMQLCTELEKIKRGVYAGAIGWFGGDGCADTSVVIRTIIIDGDKFEFQVGGAIVADSDPISEWQETLTKAKAISNTLNIDVGLL